VGAGIFPFLRLKSGPQVVRIKATTINCLYPIAPRYRQGWWAGARTASQPPTAHHPSKPMKLLGSHPSTYSPEAKLFHRASPPRAF